MATFPPAPWRSPLFDAATKLVSYIWLKWFQDFYNAILGTVDNGVLEAFDWSNNKDYGPAIRQSVDVAVGSPRSYHREVADLYRGGALLREYNGELQRKVRDLENQLALIASPAPAPVVILQDLAANKVNYPAAQYNNRLFFATDTVLLYISSAGAWVGPL